MFKTVKLEIKNKIATLSVNRPEVLNALNEETLIELKAALEQINAARSKIQVVIFTGSGEKAFIAGADISAMKGKDPKMGEAFARLGQSVTEQIEQLFQPVIAAVNGYALGGGCELAMACDFIIASERAVFGQPEVGLGIIPFFGGCYRLQRKVGMARAKELIYSGRKITANEAKAIGLVLEVVQPSELLTRAIEMGNSIQQMSSSAIAQAKKTIQQLANLPVSEGLKTEAKSAGALFGSHDQQEGMGAFLEKRKAVFNSFN